MNRREIISVVPTVIVPLAGCSKNERTTSNQTQGTLSEKYSATDHEETDSGPHSGGTSPTHTQKHNKPLAIGEEFESENGSSVRIDDIYISGLIQSFSVGSPTHVGIACLAGHQFAVVDISATDSNGDSIVEDLNISIELDGERYPTRDNESYWSITPKFSVQEQLPAFPVPVIEAKSGAIIWERANDEPVRWDLPEETVEQFGLSPDFSVTGLTTPGTVARGDNFEATFTVKNNGQKTEYFMAEFGHDTRIDSTEVLLEVPKGEQRSYTKLIKPQYSENEDESEEEIKVILDWGCDQGTVNLAKEMGRFGS